MGEPDIHVGLAVRLLKNWHKYQEHFHEFPEKLRDILKKYFSESEITGPCDYKVLKTRLTHENLSESNRKYPEYKIRYDHREFLKKYVFTHPDKRDFYLIRFFTNTTKGTCTRLFPKCVCGEDNDATHRLDHCKKLLSEELRNEYLSKARKLLEQAGAKITKKETLYELCSMTYFTVTEGKDKQSLRKMVEMMKEIIFKIVINHKEEI